MLSSCATGIVDSDRLYIGICPVTYRDSRIPTQLRNQSQYEYRVNQPDVWLCNRLSGCITGIQLHNQHSWPSMWNTYTSCKAYCTSLVKLTQQKIGCNTGKLDSHQFLSTEKSTDINGLLDRRSREGARIATVVTTTVKTGCSAYCIVLGRGTESAARLPVCICAIYVSLSAIKYVQTASSVS